MALTLADYNMPQTYRYSTVPTLTVKPLHATRDAETRRKLYLLQRRRQARQKPYNATMSHESPDAEAERLEPLFTLRCQHWACSPATAVRHQNQQECL